VADGPDAVALPWTDEEQHAVENLRAELGEGAGRAPEGLLFQIAHSRQLDAPHAADIWRRHLQAHDRLRVADVTDAEVIDAYSVGFCVCCGKDVDGRPMIWVRMKLSEPSTMSPALVVRNTWLAQDSVLAGSDDGNRNGICFVYDLRGVGLKNVSFDPVAVGSSLWGATSHASHISRVWLLDAPRIFFVAWAACKHFVPSHLRELVRFHSIDADSDAPFDVICPGSELPAYAGGDAARFGGVYSDVMLDRLQRQELAYRPAPVIHSSVVETEWLSASGVTPTQGES